MATAKSAQSSEQDTESTSYSSRHTPNSSGSNTPNTLEQDREFLFDADDIDAAFEDNKHNEDLPKYDASSSPARCAILPSRPAVWTVKNAKDMDIKLSSFVAAILLSLSQGIISTKDFDYTFQPTLADQGPTNPITGLFKSVHGTFDGVVQGLVDYPVEISKIVQADGDVAKGLATDLALDSNKGISRIDGTALKAPMDFTTNIWRGFGNVPKLYGDTTVRKTEKVDGLLKGLEAGGKGFGLGIWDGVTGLVTQPVKGAKERRRRRFFFTGFGKGIGGAVFKPIAGAIGVPANALKGVYEEISRLSTGSEDDKARAVRLKQGNEEWGMCNGEERQAMLGMWRTFYGHGPVGLQDDVMGEWN